jgi:hypothetical protein
VSGTVGLPLRPTGSGGVVSEFAKMVDRLERGGAELAPNFRGAAPRLLEEDVPPTEMSDVELLAFARVMEATASTPLEYMDRARFANTYAAIDAELFGRGLLPDEAQERLERLARLDLGAADGAERHKMPRCAVCRLRIFPRSAAKPGAEGWGHLATAKGLEAEADHAAQPSEDEKTAMGPGVPLPDDGEVVDGGLLAGATYGQFRKHVEDDHGGHHGMMQDLKQSGVGLFRRMVGRGEWSTHDYVHQHAGDRLNHNHDRDAAADYVRELDRNSPPGVSASKIAHNGKADNELDFPWSEEAEGFLSGGHGPISADINLNPNHAVDFWKGIPGGENIKPGYAWSVKAEYPYTEYPETFDSGSHETLEGAKAAAQEAVGRAHKHYRADEPRSREGAKPRRHDVSDDEVRAHLLDARPEGHGRGLPPDASLAELHDTHRQYHDLRNPSNAPGDAGTSGPGHKHSAVKSSRGDDPPQTWKTLGPPTGTYGGKCECENGACEDAGTHEASRCPNQADRYAEMYGNRMNICNSCINQTAREASVEDGDADPFVREAHFQGPSIAAPEPGDLCQLCGTPSNPSDGVIKSFVDPRNPAEAAVKMHEQHFHDWRQQIGYGDHAVSGEQTDTNLAGPRGGESGSTTVPSGAGQIVININSGGGKK